MAITNALVTARSGILAAQAAIDVTSRNIANATTDGYTAKIHNQSTRIIAGAGQGVKVDELTRSVTEGLQRDFFQQSSAVEELTIIDSFLERMVQLFGRPEDNDSISGKLTDLKAAWQDLAVSPELSTRQTDVIVAANELALELNRLSEEIQALRAEADARIDDGVTTVNTKIGEIETLNNQIGQRIAQGQSTADLEDARDLAVKEIQDLLSVRTFERSNGEITLLTSTSRVLLDDTTFPLDFTATNTFVAGTTGNNLSISTLGVLTNITSEARDQSDGEIAGLLRLRDTLLPQAQAQLDAFAFELMTTFGTLTVAGSNEALELFHDTANAVPGASSAGLANGIQVRAALLADPTLLSNPDTGGGTYTPTGAGDSALALAVIAQFEASQTFDATVGGVTVGLNTSNTLEGYSAQLISFQANRKGDFESQLTFQQNFRDALRDRFNDESAVNIDVELSRLIELENSFSASARVITTVQAALDELINTIR